MTDTTSKLADWAFQLEDNPGTAYKIPPQDIIHALLPPTSVKKKFMPKGATGADQWMVTHGNPLALNHAAIKLVEDVDGASMWTLTKLGDKRYHASVTVNGHTGEAETPYSASAVVAALLNAVEG